MATEAEYDELVAPILLDAAKACERLGMTLVARCEWKPGESGITQMGDMSKSAGQAMTHAAAHAHGNVDSMLIHLLRTMNVSQSAFLRRYKADA